jgi:pectate lyase
MKKRLGLLILASLLAHLSPELWAAGLVGYGSHTTGGANGPTCLVTSLNDAGPGSLRECATRTGAARIRFALSGIVRLNSPIRIAADKTLDGRGQDITIVGQSMVLLELRESNVIISDLKLRVLQRAGSACANPSTPTQAKGCGDAIMIKGDVRDVWIHHNHFQQCGEKCIVSGYDAFWKLPDRISISHNFFVDSFYAVLIEAIPSAAVSSPNYSHVSIYENHFKNIFRRSPRISGLVKGHVFNNYIQLWGYQNTFSCTGANASFASSSVGEAQLLLEKNVFVPWLTSACNKAVNIERYDNGVDVMGIGLSRSESNLLLNGAQESESFPYLVEPPQYAYSPMNVANVVSLVRQRAGPRP